MWISGDELVVVAVRETGDGDGGVLCHFDCSLDGTELPQASVEIQVRGIVAVPVFRRHETRPVRLRERERASPCARQLTRVPGASEKCEKNKVENFQGPKKSQNSPPIPKEVPCFRRGGGLK